MKKIILLFTLAFSSITVAQENVTPEMKATKLTAIITNQYAEEYSIEVSSEKENFKELQARYGQLNASFSIADYYKVLEDIWNEARDKISKPIYEKSLKFFSDNKEKVPLDKFDKFIDKIGLSNDQRKYIKQLSKDQEYIDFRAKYCVSQKKEGSKKKNKSVTTEGDVPTDEVGFFNFRFNILHVVLIVIILALLTIRAVRGNSNNKKKEPENRSCRECVKNESEINRLKSVKNGLDEKIEKLNKQLEKLNNEKRSSNQNLGTDNIEPLSSPISQTFEKPASSGKTIHFFPAPSSSGTFRADGASKVKKINISVYRFELDSENSTTAKVFFDPDLEMAYGRVLNSPDSNILPVCNEENAFNQQARKIETVEPGTAHLNGDQWEVREENKVRIKYL